MKSFPIVAISRTALTEAWVNQRSFWTQVLLMVTNNAVWVVFWQLLFRQIGDIRGWNVDDIMVLFAVVTTAVGLGLGMCVNVRKLNQIITDGGLDPVLTLPVSPLGFILARRVNPTALGDAVFGLLLFLLLCNPTPGRFTVYLSTALLGAIVLVSFLVTVASLAFFTRSRSQHVDVVFDSITIFGVYPIDLFGGVTKLLLFTVLPVAFISSIPAGLVNDFSLLLFTGLVTFALGISLSARIVFNAGLKRYRSGASWTSA